MKKILLSFVMAIVSLGMWAAPSVSFDGSTATITNDGNDFLNIDSDAKGIQLFGPTDWKSIKESTTLKFVGKFDNLDGFSSNTYIDPQQYSPSVAEIIDFSDARFQTELKTIQPEGYWDASQNEMVYPPSYTVPYSKMKFTYWSSTIKKAITPKARVGENGEIDTTDEILNVVVPSAAFPSAAPRMEEVEFNAGIIEGIKANASEWTSLSKVTFNEGVTEIGDQAFNTVLKGKDDNGVMVQPNLYENMKTLDLPSTLTKVGKQAFMGANPIENISMAPLKGNCEFGINAFELCRQLKHVTLSEGVKNISDHMFDKCGMLESIRIPSSCETIGESAFSVCGSLHSVVIPEGVQIIKKNAFINSGLTDIYVMASQTSTVPQIYSLGHDNLGSNTGTFSSGMVDSDSYDPYDVHKDDIGTASEETILTWYQDDRSNGALGIGGGSCMVRLHYPESMRYFYDGYENPLAPEVTNWSHAIDRLSTDLLQSKLEAIQAGDTHYISDAYAVGNTTYPAFGEDNNGNYWPRGSDYYLRLQSGSPALYDLTEPSSMGWRQLPLQTTSEKEDYIFSKEYDDTWYTMCFPWDMEDNQLFSTFNNDLEIAEFVGAEVIDVSEEGADVKNYNLIFHFDRVARTYYMTENHLTDGLEYERVEGYTVDGQPTTRVQTISVDGGNIDKKYYTYHRIKGTEGPEYVYWPLGTLPKDKKNYTPVQRELVDRYDAILHLMVFAGHPYMIHPATGTKINQPVNCTFFGVKNLAPGLDKDANNTFLKQLARDSAVVKTATIDGTAYNKPGTQAFEGGGSYTFIGNINDYPASATAAEKREKMTDATNTVAYFLAVDPAKSYYPKYYRKSKENESKPSWSQYSAIIRPDATALESIEQYIVAKSNASTSVNGFDVKFGEWETVSPTEIKEIVSEAEKKGQEVKEMHLNVVFNVNGQVVRTGTPSVEGLPSGMYIVNGKKYMVK